MEKLQEDCLHLANPLAPMLAPEAKQLLAPVKDDDFLGKDLAADEDMPKEPEKEEVKPLNLGVNIGSLPISNANTPDMEIVLVRGPSRGWYLLNRGTGETLRLRDPEPGCIWYMTYEKDKDGHILATLAQWNSSVEGWTPTHVTLANDILKLCLHRSMDKVSWLHQDELPEAQQGFLVRDTVTKSVSWRSELVSAKVARGVVHNSPSRDGFDLPPQTFFKLWIHQVPRTKDFFLMVELAYVKRLLFGKDSEKRWVTVNMDQWLKLIATFPELGDAARHYHRGSQGERRVAEEDGVTLSSQRIAELTYEACGTIPGCLIAMIFYIRPINARYTSDETRATGRLAMYGLVDIGFGGRTTVLRLHGVNAPHGELTDVEVKDGFMTVDAADLLYASKVKLRKFSEDAKEIHVIDVLLSMFPDAWKAKAYLKREVSDLILGIN